MVEMLSYPITLSLNLVSVAIVPLPYLHSSLSNILTLTEPTSSYIHHMGAKVGIVSFDVVFPACLRDFHLFESNLHPTASDTLFSVMVLEVPAGFG